MEDGGEANLSSLQEQFESLFAFRHVLQSLQASSIVAVRMVNGDYVITATAQGREIFEKSLASDDKASIMEESKNRAPKGGAKSNTENRKDTTMTTATADSGVQTVDTPKGKRGRPARPEVDKATLGVPLDDEGRINGAVEYDPAFKPLVRGDFANAELYCEYKLSFLRNRRATIDEQISDWELQLEEARNGVDPNVKMARKAQKMAAQLAELKAQLEAAGIDTSDLE